MIKSFKKYSEYYDLIYKDKDYRAECDFVEGIFRRYSNKPLKNILDAGCGTGGHAIPLAERGYKVTGFDLSETMVKGAVEKVRERNIDVKFHVMDLRNFNLNKKFDACICLFAVMDYITESDDIQKAIKNIRRHLKENSLFIFDFWNGLAVLRILPSARTKIMEEGKRRVIRIAEPQLDAFNHVCKVHYKLIALENNAVIDEIKETHTVRFYFPQEIKHYLTDAGFELLEICPFMELNRKVDENVWNIAAIAKV